MKPLMAFVEPGSNTVPIEKGTETKIDGARIGDAVGRSNTVPIEKGTETKYCRPSATGVRQRSNTVPIEKGTETVRRGRI